MAADANLSAQYRQFRRTQSSKGMVVAGAAAGWSLMRRDDVLEFKTRLTLETTTRRKSNMSWKGLRHGPKEVIDRL